MKKKLLTIALLFAMQSVVSQSLEKIEDTGTISHKDPKSLGFSGSLNINVIQGPHLKIKGTIAKSAEKEDEYNVSVEIAPEEIEQKIEQIEIKVDDQGQHSVDAD